MNFTSLLFLIFKPKIVIFSQEGSYSRLINFLSKKDIISMGFQHGMQSGSIPIFRHGKFYQQNIKHIYLITLLHSGTTGTNILLLKGCVSWQSSIRKIIQK